MSAGLRIVILSRARWGLGQDAAIIEQALREVNASAGRTSDSYRIESIDHMDPFTFYGSGRKPHPVDINIHLEIPCRAAWKWARYNIVMVNPEWWVRGAWDWALAGANMFLFKSAHARSLFPTIDEKRCRIMTWRCAPEISAALSHLEKGSPPRKEFLYLIGGSVNKLVAAKQVCAAWRATWPKLCVVAAAGILDELRKHVPEFASRGIELKESYRTDKERIEAQSLYAYHVVASGAEGFGFTFAEAAAVGALPLWTDLPVYKEHWGTILGNVGCIVSSDAAASTSRYMESVQSSWTSDAIIAGVESLLKLEPEEELRLRGALRHSYTVRIREFRNNWKSLSRHVYSKLRSLPRVALPPRLPAVEDLPHVAIITVTRNRPRWFANMARNVLHCDYPPNKLTWVVADDSDGTVGRIDSAVAKFQSDNPRINVKYLSFPKQLHIGAKRNRACEAAPPEATVFVMMDDDDHYPKSSVIARVSWLTATGAQCVYSAVLPMYDCTRYISAINVPPLDLGPAERISEATLCFTRAFWEARKFPGPVSVAEGEGFVVGRETETIEMPPEGVIVSFLHGGNATSRRVPESTEPNGCHYGFDDEYFSYISSLAVDLKG